MGTTRSVQHEDRRCAPSHRIARGIPYSISRYFTTAESIKQIYFSMRGMEEVSDAATEIAPIAQSRHRPNSIYKARIRLACRCHESCH